MKSSFILKNKGYIAVAILIAGIFIEKFSDGISDKLSEVIYYITNAVLLLVPAIVIVVINRREKFGHENNLKTFFKFDVIAIIIIAVVSLTWVTKGESEKFIALVGRYLLWSGLSLLIYLGYYEWKSHWERM